MWYLERVNSLKVEQNNSLGISLFPNPSSNGVFQINIDNGDNTEKFVRIFNIQGQEVFKQTFSYNPVINARLESGIYLISVEMERGTYTEKLIVP